MDKENKIARIDEKKILSTRNIIPYGNKRTNVKEALKKIRGNDKPLEGK